MSSPSSPQAPTIAFFGATGGVCNSVLIHALRAGTHVSVLARTPSKLTKQLQAQGISESTIAKQVTIITGNALDVAAVKATLTGNNSSTTPTHLVHHIVSGLGGTPHLQWSLLRPVTIDQPTICRDAAHTLVAALRDLQSQNPSLKSSKPKLSYVSTTGITDGPEDVPFGLQTLYHYFLAVPHQDKRDLEDIFSRNVEGEEGTRVFGGVVGVRPTLLTGGVNADAGKGVEKLRAGTEREPTLGYTVSRADVGEWMWVNVVGDDERRKRWENLKVTLA